MSRTYEPLMSFLASKGREVPMSFREIEGILGRRLPRSAFTHRAWWSNNPSNNPMTRAWLDAGFESEQVDMAAERLVFRRQMPTAAPSAPTAPQSAAPEPVRALAGPVGRVHSLFGSMRGSVTFVPGYDLTAPADPDWAILVTTPAQRPER